MEANPEKFMIPKDDTLQARLKRLGRRIMDREASDITFLPLEPEVASEAPPAS